MKYKSIAFICFGLLGVLPSILSAPKRTAKPAIRPIVTQTPIPPAPAVPTYIVNVDPTGVLDVNIPANSDAILAAPIYRAAEFKGVVESISGSIITVAGPSPLWGVNKYVQSLPAQPNTYAVLVTTGTKEGMTVKITANTANTITIQTAPGENLTNVATEVTNGVGLGDHIDIIPYWTPSSLIVGAVPNFTEMYLFDNTTTGQNISPTLPLQYSSSGSAWFETVGFTDQSHRPILFGRGFIVRNNAASTVTFSFVGSVPMAKNRLVLRTLAANTSQDQTIGYMSPVPETLVSVNIGAQDNDELYFFDNSVGGKNKSPSFLLVFFGGRWYDSITFTDVTDTMVLQPTSAMIYRKFPTASAQNFIWSDLQTYLQP